MADANSTEPQNAQQDALMEGILPQETRPFSFSALNEGSSCGDIASPRLSSPPARSCWCSTAVPDLIQIRRHWAEEYEWFSDMREEISQVEKIAMQWPLSILVGIPPNWDKYDEIMFQARHSVVDLWDAWAEGAQVAGV